MTNKKNTRIFNGFRNLESIKFEVPVICLVFPISPEVALSSQAEQELADFVLCATAKISQSHFLHLVERYLCRDEL